MNYEYCAFNDDEALLDFAVNLNHQTQLARDLADHFEARAEALNDDSSPYAAQIRTTAFHYREQAKILSALEEKFLNGLSDETHERVDPILEVFFSGLSRKAV